MYSNTLRKLAKDRTPAKPKVVVELTQSEKDEIAFKELVIRFKKGAEKECREQSKYLGPQRFYDLLIYEDELIVENRMDDSRWTATFKYKYWEKFLQWL